MHGFNNGCGYGSQVTAIRAELSGDTAKAKAAATGKAAIPADLSNPPSLRRGAS
jgi:hypothetical protein